MKFFLNKPSTVSFVWVIGITTDMVFLQVQLIGMEASTGDLAEIGQQLEAASEILDELAILEDPRYNHYKSLFYAAQVTHYFTQSR